MENNVRFLAVDWKDPVDAKWLHQAIMEIEALGRGSQVVEENSPVCDSKVILVIPADANFQGITEDTSDILGFCDKMSIDEDGKFHFTFLEDCGMPATPWLDETKAAIWVNGMSCSDELVQPSTLSAEEIEEFTEAKQKALDLLY